MGAVGAADVGDYGWAKTSVWWDIENCAVPRGSGEAAHMIAQHISSALAAVGYRGPVSISAYGDISRIPSDVQRALSSTGVSLLNVPSGVKDASDKKILVDMLLWAVDNPPPANYLLISGDRDFSNALHQLSMRRYNILLAHSPNVSQALVAAARIVWLWSSLVTGGHPKEISDFSHSAIASSAEVSNPIPTRTVYSTSDSSSDNAYCGNQRNYGNNKPDNNRNKAKQVKRIASQQKMFNIPRTVSNEFREPPSPGGHSYGATDHASTKVMQVLQQPYQTSTSTISTAEAFDGAKLKHGGGSSSFSYSSANKQSSQFVSSNQTEAKHFGKAPHEFFEANKHSSKGSLKHDQHSSCTGYSKNAESSCQNNQQAHYTSSVWPNDRLPLQSNFTQRNSYPPNCHNHYLPPPPFWPGTHPSTLGPPSNMPDMNTLNISGSSSSVQHSMFTPPIRGSYVPAHHDMCRPQTNAIQNDGMQAPGYQVTPDFSQSLVGNILQALNQLKTGKIIPTEANIRDCIQYGEMAIQNFNVRMALDYAIEQKKIMVHKLGNNLPFYTVKDEKLWKCVNIMDSSVKHPQSVWDAIQKFLSSPAGRSAVLASESRFHAAFILHKSCLRSLTLGDILQILQVMVHSKKWIVASSFGWQPLSITLPVVTKSKSDDGVGSKH